SDLTTAMSSAVPTCLRSPVTLSRTTSRSTCASAGASMTSQSASQDAAEVPVTVCCGIPAARAGLLSGQGPVLVLEVPARLHPHLGAVHRGTARVGEAQAVELQHVFAVGPVRPGLGLVAVAGPDHQLGAVAALADVVQALAKDRQRTTGEGPVLGRGAVA